MAFRSLLLSCRSVLLSSQFVSRRYLSTPASARDLNNIMKMLGFGSEAPAQGDASDFLTTRRAVSEFLEKSKNPVDQAIQSNTPPLTPAQEEELQRHVRRWTEKYQLEWEMGAHLHAVKERRLESINAKNNSADSERLALHQEDEKRRAEQEEVLALLPSIAEQYVRDAVNWDQEFVSLEQEVQRLKKIRKAQRFAKAYLESDPLRGISEKVQKELNPEPVIVQLSTLLEYIDPRFATKLAETGMVLEDRRVDMSKPHEVVKTLTDLGYSVNNDGELTDVNHLTFPYEAQQRENLMRGLRPDGTPMSENEKWQKILETPEISSPALNHKRKQIDFFMRQQRRSNQTPPVSAFDNPEILPEELRPTIEDLDPDTKPLFVNRDVIHYTACPICQKPKEGPGSRRKCGLGKTNQANITHTNVELLTHFVNELGMILPKKKTGVCSKQQRQLATAIKRSRQMGLMPYMSKLKFGKACEGRNFELFNMMRRNNLLPSRQSNNFSSL